MLPKLDARSLIAIDPDGQRRVDELRKSSSFLLPDGSDSFRYHDLFRDYLEHELRRRGDAVFRQTLIGAASKLVSSGSYDQGLTIYLTYRLTSHLDELLEKYGWLLLEAGSVDRVSSALNLIEKSVFAKSPILLSLQARIDDGAGVYDSADLLFERALALSWESEISALIAERWAVSLLNRFLIDRAHQVVHSVDLSRCTDVNISARLLGLMAAIEVRVGRVAEAERRLGEGLQRLPMISDGQTLALFLHYAAYVSLWLGRSIDARDYCLKALALSRELGLYDLGGRASSVLHEVSASRDDARGLSYSLKEMTRFGRLSGDPGLRQFALFSQYDAAVERGDVETAKALQAEVRAEMPVDEERWAQTVVAAEAMRLAIDGRFKEAYRLEAKYRLERCPPAARALRAAEIALYAACDDESPLAQVEADTAISLLRKASALDDVLSARLLKAMALTGLALLKQGRIDESKETLRATNISLNGGGSAGLLLGAVKCALALAAGAPVELKFEKTMESLASSRLGGYAALLEAVGVNPRFGAIALTTTEVKIMNLLRVGFSSKEIASRLGRSRFTVDTHVKTILRKLACNSRWEAVAKLAKRGFFETGPDG
jgi:ATP/maltotriose-dependent transcriptional regulator MalT